MAHAAGQFFRIGSLETIEADRVEHFHAALVAFGGIDATGLQRGLDVLKHGKPGEQGEALENDGDVDFGIGDGLFMPVNLAGGRPGQTGEHTQHRRLARTGGAKQGDNLAGHDAEVGCRDDLNAVFARLGVVFFDLFGADDRFSAFAGDGTLDCRCVHSKFSGRGPHEIGLCSPERVSVYLYDRLVLQVYDCRIAGR